MTMTAAKEPQSILLISAHSGRKAPPSSLLQVRKRNVEVHRDSSRVTWLGWTRQAALCYLPAMSPASHTCSVCTGHVFSIYCYLASTYSRHKGYRPCCSGSVFPLNGNSSLLTALSPDSGWVPETKPEKERFRKTRWFGRVG